MLLFRIAGWILAALVAVPVGVFAAVCLCAHRPGRAKAADCLIVLGARIYADGRLSHSLQRRCAAAAAAYHRGAAPWVIACGGQSGGEPEPEAWAMKRILCAQGVDEKAILLEKNSTNTVENLRNAREIMHRRQLRSAIVLTSDYHLTRALWIARALGIEARGIPAQGPLTPAHIFKSRVVETASWFKYFFCWLKFGTLKQKEK